MGAAGEGERRITGAVGDRQRTELYGIAIARFAYALEGLDEDEIETVLELVELVCGQPSDVLPRQV